MHFWQFSEAMASCKHCIQGSFQGMPPNGATDTKLVAESCRDQVQQIQRHDSRLHQKVSRHCSNGPFRLCTGSCSAEHGKPQATWPCDLECGGEHQCREKHILEGHHRSLPRPAVPHACQSLTLSSQAAMLVLDSFRDDTSLLLCAINLLLMLS